MKKRQLKNIEKFKGKELINRDINKEILFRKSKIPLVKEEPKKVVVRKKRRNVCVFFESNFRKEEVTKEILVAGSSPDQLVYKYVLVHFSSNFFVFVDYI